MAELVVAAHDIPARVDGVALAVLLGRALPVCLHGLLARQHEVEVPAENPRHGIALGTRLGVLFERSRSACARPLLGIHHREVQWEGVQWIGVVLYNELVYNSIQITTPCFHCTPL